MLSAMLFGKKNPADSFPMRTPAQLKEKLEAAKPAESPPRSYYQSGAGADGAEYPHLGTLVTQADGVWACCCGHENELIHYRGAFPFKYLTCGKCDHVACSTCQMSDILTPQDGAPCLEEVAKRGQEVRFCFVCNECGLSYRAVKHAGSVHPPETCHCGNEFGAKWPRYRIGSVDAYRRDPVKAAHDAKHELCLRKSQKVHEDARAETVHKQRLREERRKEMERLRAQQPLELRTQDEWRVKERPQRRPQPLRLAGYVQEVHWPPPSPPLQTEPPAVQSQPPLGSDSGACLLQRSGAQRGKPFKPQTPRSATWDNRNSQASSQRPSSLALRRAETWTTANDNERLNNEAHGFVKSTFGTRNYKKFKGTHVEEAVMKAAREDLLEEVLASGPPVQRTVTSNNPDDQAPAVRRLLLTRAYTDNF